MGYIENIVVKYLVFRGRTNRKDFWVCTLILACIAAIILMGIALLAKILMVVANRAPVPTDFRFPFWILNVFRFIVLTFAWVLPMLALTTRRLHDINMSGWWVVLGVVLAPVAYAAAGFYGIGIIKIIFIILLVLPSAKGQNKYGN